MLNSKKREMLDSFIKNMQYHIDDTNVHVF